MGARKEQSQRQNLFKGGNHNILNYLLKGFKACLASKDSDQFGQPSLGVVFLLSYILK